MNNGWSIKPPVTQGIYWHWNGDDDSAPIPTFVLWSGALQKCFVSAGQLGIIEAVDCDQYGGMWKWIVQPSAPRFRQPRIGRIADEPNRAE